MFALVLDSGETVRGVVVADMDFAAVRPLLGERVVVAGLARFRPSGRVLRVEADQLVRADGDTSVWAAPPKPLLQELDARSLRQPQGPKSGVAAIFGQWPGDEGEEDFAAALRPLMISATGLQLLDTNIVLHLVRGNVFGKSIDDSYGLRSRSERPLVSVVTVGEILSLGKKFNWGNKKQERMLELIREFGSRGHQQHRRPDELPIAALDGARAGEIRD